MNQVNLPTMISLNWMKQINTIIGLNDYVNHKLSIALFDGVRKWSSRVHR